MTAGDLLAGLYPERDLARYLKRQRCSPQPGMRRVDRRAGGFACLTYEAHEWALRDVVTTVTDAVAFWLSDPWLPNEPLGRADPHRGAVDVADDWTPRQWDEVIQGLVFHVVTETGARPHEIGPASEWTSGLVYDRLRSRGAAAQVYWSEGRSRLDDLRAECPVRVDLPRPLRCVVLAEATVLLLRRPHHRGYLYVDVAPDGVAAEAAAILTRFGVPPRTLDLLVR